MTTQERFAVGARIGDYQITRELARTAATATYLGEHAVLPRVAIVKTAVVRAAAVPLLREACILEALHHAGIPTVYESGVVASGRPWFATEHIDGVDLADLRDLAPLQVAAIVREVAAILDHAHRRGVVHAALRPERILVTDGSRGSTVFVVDWSEARTHDAIAGIPRLPAPGARAYTAPDARHAALDDLADVFALGAIAYQMLAGVPPGGERAVPLAIRCPHVPDELCTLVDQMISRERFDRPTAGQVWSELDWAGAVQRASVDGVEPAAVEVVDVELRAIDGDVDDPPAAPASPPPSLRVRRPRWTPAGAPAAEPREVGAGELHARTKPGEAR